MNDFLSEYKPSCITSKFIPLAGGGLSDMRVEWIAVNRGMHTLDLQRPPLIEEMKISFKSSINSYSPILDELARAYNITSGKWLIFLGPDQVDNLWTKVVSLIWLQRKRGFAKVSSHSCVISVYVVEGDLRSIGVDRRISFKPDAYSHLGIYRNNEWGIPPSRYIL
ncbi:translation initiation factor eIF 4e-like domain-containing protein [Rhodocollybia butyracea]|uniref:Translation initiation factor eIF 4e-like domain-containing protein n=1 Tax=Rhodocollybia butyracea TaxID=206335 RepID=A0A9P5PDG9_9AGAR|nr:translation initiation factor eIF 4e-like domain-containing protein [Rhodocollybia butyracea]